MARLDAASVSASIAARSLRRRRRISVLDCMAMDTLKRIELAANGREYTQIKQRIYT
jgi:hypothetical protein